ncbi:MFS general substrate transporter [Ceratobasidium theobromae]|uniref:MFS general substrate transporter n=1 Tax=Ceratobasidium theobromae TaxID=1582974 RepID=A0A5N5QY83_9AGAM|nr:MFS general substrate transporter [Ceratobasidium theobromae]
MDTKVTLETSATVTPAISLHHDSPGESIEMTVLNQSQNGETQSELPKSIAGVEDDPAAVRREMIAMASVCWTQFMAGWNDGTLGPLIPTIQQHFNIGFITVSMLFVSACAGYVTGAVAVIHLTDKFGFGRVLIAGSLCQIVAYTILSAAPPFPVMCATLVINGIGMSFQNAQTGGMVVSLTRNPGTKMGLLHAGYGAGACVSPLISTQFTQIPRWSFYFLASLGLAISNTIFQSLVFGFRTLPEILASFGIPEVVHTADATRTSKYRQILSLRIIYVLAFFALLYVGTEVTIGGWIVTFLIENRGGGTSAGYVSSGFFAGLMLGRLVLIWVNQKIGERRAVYLYSCIIIGLEFVIWFTPSLILNAVAVSFVGLLLVFKFKLGCGFWCPQAMIQSVLSDSHETDWRLLTGAISLIASSGMSGSAIFPFITGVMAQKRGVQVLQPLIVGLLGMIVITWALIPRIGKKGD